jgi:hypothetical protein
VESVEQFAPVPSGDVESTGDTRVDAVLEMLAELVGASTGDQVAVYDRVQRGLQECLAEAEPGAAGAASPG